MKLENFIYSILISGFLIGVITLLIGSLGTTYGVDVNTSQLNSYQKINDTYNQALKGREKVDNTTRDPSIIDKLGNYVGLGIDAAKIFYSSFDNAEALIIDGSDVIPMEGSSDLLQKTLYSLLIVGFIFAIIYVWTKVKA